MKRRMGIKFGEIAQEIAIVHELPQNTVELVLNAYSGAVRRGIKEGMIVEVVRDLRLQEEDVFNAARGIPIKRVVVNDERHRRRRAPTGATTSEIEKEHDRTAQALHKLVSGDG